MSTFLRFIFLVFILFRPPDLKANDTGSPSQERVQAPPQSDQTPSLNSSSQQSDISRPVSLVNETSAPSAIVNNSVNVITGAILSFQELNV